MSIVNGVTTVYLGDYYEYEVGTGITHSYYGSGEAMRVEGASDPAANGVFYLLKDHLGSTSLTVDSSGNVLGEIRYKAWGETRYASGDSPTTYGYTGQRQEPDLGFYYYKARWYDPSLGRFMQADTIVPEAGNPLALDRYGYGLNNPVRFSDPTGHLSRDQLMDIFGVNKWGDVLSIFEDGGRLEGKWGWLQTLRKAKIGDEIHFLNGYGEVQGLIGVEVALSGKLIEDNGEIVIQIGDRILSIIDAADIDCTAYAVLAPKRNMYKGVYYADSKVRHLQLKEPDKIDYLDLGVDSFGIIGDIAFLFPPIGTFVWAASEVPELLTIGKPWDQLDTGDPSGVIWDLGTTILQTTKLVPEGGWFANLVGIGTNILGLMP